MSTEDFKNKLHKILNEDYDMSKFELKEDSEPKQEFIFSDSTGKSYNIQVEKDENEFYVYDQNGKKLDIFQMDMLDLDGGISKDLRKEIVNHYRKNVSKEEVVAEMKTQDRYEDGGFVKQDIKPKPAPTEAQAVDTVKITKPVVVKETVTEKLKPFTVAPKTSSVLEDIPVQFNAIIDGQKHEIYSSAADVYFNFYKGDVGMSQSFDKTSGNLSEPGSPSSPDEYEIVAISVGGNPKDDGYIFNLDTNATDVEFAKLPNQVDIAPLMDDAAHKQISDYLATYQNKDMTESVEKQEPLIVEGHPVVVTDVPYGGGMSQDKKTVYIDKRIPRFFTIDGKKLDVHKAIAGHELAEVARMDRGESYEVAHNHALHKEDVNVDHQGFDHAVYENTLKPYLDEAKKLADKSKIPKDLDPRPYQFMKEESLIKEDAKIKKNFKSEYGDRGEAVYYATANKQHRNPETFKKLEEVEDIKKKFRDQYGKRGNSVYYATANKEHRNPETFKKLEENKNV
jgi:hypothetical protein